MGPEVLSLLLLDAGCAALPEVSRDAAGRFVDAGCAALRSEVGGCSALLELLEAAAGCSALPELLDATEDMKRCMAP